MKKLYFEDNKILVAEIQSSGIRNIIEIAKNNLPYNKRNPLREDSIFLYKEKNKHYFLIKNSGHPYIGVLTRKGFVEVQNKVDFKEIKKSILLNLSKALYLKIGNAEKIIDCSKNIIAINE